MRLRVMADLADGGQSVYLLVRLEAEAASPTERRPVNLALAIDRSSSMRGPRLAQALRAAGEVVARLDERDRLTVIVFDGTARVAFGPATVTADRRAELQHALGSIEAGAGTNLAAAIRKGSDALRSGYVRGAISRLVVLTDGQPSVGVIDVERLCAMAEAEVQLG